MLGAVTVELLAVAALGAYWLARGPTAHAVEDWDVLIALHTSWCSSGARDGQPELSFAEQRP